MRHCYDIRLYKIFFFRVMGGERLTLQCIGEDYEIQKKILDEKFCEVRVQLVEFYGS